MTGEGDPDYGFESDSDCDFGSNSDSGLEFEADVEAEYESDFDGKEAKKMFGQSAGDGQRAASRLKFLVHTSSFRIND